MSQNTLETPADLLRFQLRVARTMEDDSLAALGDLASAAQSSEVKKLFRHHADETREQIQNLTQVFALLEFPESTAPSPATTGISKHAHALIERASAPLRDVVTLSAALGNEHFEISAYESLIIAVEAVGNDEALALLRANLDQETHTSEELRTRLKEMQQVS